jgi:pimeloyl-ACP methyl ester carboxylesterase
MVLSSSSLLLSSSSSSSSRNTFTTEELLNDHQYMRQTLKLSDGRQLSFSESGQPFELGGEPVLFHFGLMASSLVVALFHHEALRKNLNLVAIDYPGIGESTPCPNRTLMDWPRDVKEFVVAKWGPNTSFALLAHSMGATHALYVVADPDIAPRISRWTLVSPWILLPNDWWTWMSQTWIPSVVNQTILPHMTTTWTASTLSMSGSISTCSTTTTTTTKTKTTKISNRKEQHHLNRSRNIDITHRIIAYSYHRGQEGNRQMARLALQPHPWPESLDRIPTNFGMPIWIVCGDDDHLVSPESCRKLQQQLGGPTKYATFPNVNHNSILSGIYLAQIFATLTNHPPAPDELLL